MTTRKFLKTMTAGAALAALVVFGVLIVQPAGRAASDHSASDDETQMIQIGIKVAPVFLNTVGKDPDLVGLGSYIVNVLSDCNGCHTKDPATAFLPTGNPYLLMPPHGPFSGIKKTNTATYLGGGNDFGEFPSPGAIHIFSRNLTPDKSGRAEGGHTLSEFMHIMRTGVDLDKTHPTCPTNTPNCLLPPFNGALLQVMPWQAFQDMTDRQLKAIYTYLSSIPCLEGGPGEPPSRCK